MKCHCEAFFAEAILLFNGDCPAVRDAVKRHFVASLLAMTLILQKTPLPEFPTKIRICVREGLESEYWLRTILALEILDKGKVERLLRENEEIVKIVKTILRKTSF